MKELNSNEHWSELYRKALFEEDRAKLPFLLERAYEAVQKRVRELWYSSTAGHKVPERERRELHAAAYYLSLLRSLEAKNGLTREGT